MNIPLPDNICGTSKDHGVFIEDSGLSFRRKISPKIAPIDQQPILVHSSSLNALHQLPSDVVSHNQVLYRDYAAPSENKEAVLDVNVAVTLDSGPHGRSRDENQQKSVDASLAPVYEMHVDPSINYGRKVAESIQVLQDNGNLSIFQITHEKMLERQRDIMKEAEEMTSKEKDHHLPDEEVVPTTQPEPSVQELVQTILSLCSPAKEPESQIETLLQKPPSPVKPQTGSSLPEMFQKLSTLINVHNFTKGIAMTADEISTIIQRLNKDINIFVKNSDYEAFLKSYGAMSGNGYRFAGSLYPKPCTKSKINHVVAVQGGFLGSCEVRGIDPEKLNFLWLVAIHEEDFYFIDSSPNGKGYIYSIGKHLGVKKVVKSFSLFLDKVLEICDSSDTED